MAAILIVGGTGLTGAHAALHLSDKGHDVTIMSRTQPTLPALQGLAHITGSYVDNPPSESELAQFDHLVFAAGADIRQLPPGEDEAAFYERVNVQAIPAFFERARAAGISSAVYIGSYYPQVAPESIERSVYVRSRHLADEGVRALATDAFRVCSLNAPFILGYVEGLALPHLAALVQYAGGQLEGVPIVAPGGGVNHITSESMSVAIENALTKGKSGHAYLVGDENLTWKRYLELYFELVGNPQDLPVSEDEHPLFPDVMLYAGRNATVEYEPEVGELAYPRERVRATVAQIVDAYS
jgi:nucleoside-diphosphate-sugar epimerase